MRPPLPPPLPGTLGRVGYVVSYVQHAISKLAETKGFKNNTCGFSSLVLDVNGWVQREFRCVLLPL